MIITRKFYELHDEKIPTLVKMWKELYEVKAHSNPNTFMVCLNDPLFDDFFGEEDSVGNVIGFQVEIVYDDVIENVISKILRKYGL